MARPSVAARLGLTPFHPGGTTGDHIMDALQLTLLVDDRLADLRREATRREWVTVRKPSPRPQDAPAQRPVLRLLTAPLSALRRHAAWADAGR
jgi:hypothetical protein